MSGLISKLKCLAVNNFHTFIAELHKGVKRKGNNYEGIRIREKLTFNKFRYLGMMISKDGGGKAGVDIRVMQRKRNEDTLRSMKFGSVQEACMI